MLHLFVSSVFALILLWVCGVIIAPLVGQRARIGAVLAAGLEPRPERAQRVFPRDPGDVRDFRARPRPISGARSKDRPAVPLSAAA